MVYALPYSVNKKVIVPNKVRIIDMIMANFEVRLKVFFLVFMKSSDELITAKPIPPNIIRKLVVRLMEYCD